MGNLAAGALLDSWKKRVKIYVYLNMGDAYQ